LGVGAYLLEEKGLETRGGRTGGKSSLRGWGPSGRQTHTTDVLNSYEGGRPGCLDQGIFNRLCNGANREEDSYRDCGGGRSLRYGWGFDVEQEIGRRARKEAT